MVEQVRDRDFFHVARATSYPPLVEGQVLTIGAVYNPFFDRFNQRLDVPHNENGQNIQIAAGQWLLKALGGGFDPPPFPHRIAEVGFRATRHYAMLCRELIMEDVRTREFSEAPSRQRCLYLCDTPEDAAVWRKDHLGASGTIVRLACTGAIHRGDASILLRDGEALWSVIANAKRYWRGEMTEQPQREIVFEGTLRVIEVAEND
jgi:hypothetical protein